MTDLDRAAEERPDLSVVIPFYNEEQCAAFVELRAVTFLWRPLLDLLGMWWFSRRRFTLPREALSGADTHS